MGSIVSRKSNSSPQQLSTTDSREDVSISVKQRLPKLPMKKEGQRIPEITLKVRVRVGEGEDVKAFKWKDVSTNDLFANKRIVLFAIPGGKCFSLCI